MRSEKLYLQDIVEAVDAVARFLKDVKEEDFLSNDLLQSAVLYKLTIIGEASSHISDILKNRYPQVDWKEIIGFRIFAVHVYFRINWKIIWTTATEDTVILKKQILEILQNEFPDFDIESEN